MSNRIGQQVSPRPTPWPHPLSASYGAKDTVTDHAIWSLTCAGPFCDIDVYLPQVGIEDDDQIVGCEQIVMEQVVGRDVVGITSVRGVSISL